METFDVLPDFLYRGVVQLFEFGRNGQMKDGRVENWKRLDEVWAMVGDKPAFTKYVRGEIERMLSAGKEAKATTIQTPGPTIPTPSCSWPPRRSANSPGISWKSW